MRKNNRTKSSGEEERFLIQGKIWWGNKYFYKEGESKNKKEELAKEKFVDNNFPQVDIDNFYLFLNKYIPIIDATVRDRRVNESKKWFSLENESIGGDSKKFFLKGVIKRFKNKREYYQLISNLGRSINNQIKNLANQKYKCIFSNSLKTQSRLIIGLGSAHVLETSITLHHIYGIPYIPASALKGVCRMVAFWKIAEARGILNDENRLNDLQGKFYGELVPDEDILNYQLLFGAQNFRGLLLFLDAYPEIQENEEIFDLDIMNVHYPSYYGDPSGKTPPGDWENPRPIIFLTLKEGIKFNFNVFFDEFRANEIMKLEEKQMKKLDIPKNAKSTINEWKNNQSQLNREIMDLLERALKEFGIGAKTRLGYGIFE